MVRKNNLQVISDANLINWMVYVDVWVGGEPLAMTN